MAIYGSLGDLEVNADYPSIQPTLDLNFAKTKSLDPRITFYRNSLATYTDDKGIIRTVPENVPRFDHNPTTGESLGLLIEESRTNLHLHSENLSAWSIETGATVTSNAYISPDGTQTADALNGTMDGSSAYLITTLSNATIYTFSVFLKYISGVTNIEIQIGDTPFSRSYTTFNVQTGTLVSNTGGAATVNSIENYGNGWYRYSITRTTTAAGGAFMDINHRTTTPSTIAVWGVQVESGAFPTSYIPTSGSTVTRSADVCYMDGTNFSSWYNQSEGSIFASLKSNPGNRSANNVSVFGITPVSGPWTGNLIGQNTDSNGTWYSYDSSFSGLIQTSNLSSSVNKFSWGLTSGSSSSVVVDGTIKSSFNWGSVTRTSVFLSYDFSGSMRWNRILYYPKRLTNTQLQNLTA